MNLPNPGTLANEAGLIGHILRRLPPQAISEADRQSEPWEWLIEKAKLEKWPDGFRKVFLAAASQRKALICLSQTARDGGSISSHDWHLQIDAAMKRKNFKAADTLTQNHLKSILQTVRGRRWLLENKEAGLTAPPEMRAWARREYDKFYTADVRRLGRVKADEKWNGTGTPRFKMAANDGDYIAAAMANEWLVIGKNGFPGLCFMTDEVLATLLGHFLPVPALLNENSHGWKTVRTIRERIGLIKAGIMFNGIEQIGVKQWAILTPDGEKAHSISLLSNKPLPPEL